MSSSNEEPEPASKEATLPSIVDRKVNVTFESTHIKTTPTFQCLSSASSSTKLSSSPFHHLFHSKIINKSQVGEISSYWEKILIEKLYRLNGTSLLYSASFLLRLQPSTYATSCTIFHRFYHRCSFTQYDVWSVSMACLLLAMKVEEDNTRKIRDIVLIYAHLYRRRRFVMFPSFETTKEDEKETKREKEENDDLSSLTYYSPLATKLSIEQKENILRHVPPISTYSQTYKEWLDPIIKMENIILRELGFTMYFIPSLHPHKFILYFIRVFSLEAEKEQKLAQKAWNYCNDSMRLDLCVRFKSESIACAAIYLAASDCLIDLPTISVVEEEKEQQYPWWEVFIGKDKSQELSIICNSILGLSLNKTEKMKGNENDDDIDYLLMECATYYFIPSLLEETSFNDPGSYLWCLADSLEKID